MNIPETKEKIICGLLYTAIFFPILAWAPLIWIVIINVRGVPVKDFVKYHCYQALLFNMLAFFLPQLLALLVSFISNFLGLFGIFDNSIEILQSLTAWIINNYFIAIQLIAAYALIWTIRGKYTYLPPVSQAVNMLLR